MTWWLRFVIFSLQAGHDQFTVRHRLRHEIYISIALRIYQYDDNRKRVSLLDIYIVLRYKVEVRFVNESALGGEGSLVGETPFPGLLQTLNQRPWGRTYELTHQMNIIAQLP